MDDSEVTGGPLEDARATAAECLFCPKLLRAVLRWLERLGVPARDRGDVAGQVWLAAWRSWHKYDPKRARPARWLNRIAVHVVSHYHARAHLRREELTGEPPEVIDFTPDADAMLASSSIKVNVLDALNELDPELRSLVISHDLEGVPMADLAEAAGLPLSTLYRRRARALAALRAVVDRREVEKHRLGCAELASARIARKR